MSFTTPRNPYLASARDPLFAPPTMPGVRQIKPRVGGVLPDEGFGEPWTGGSNINPPVRAMHLTQRRPVKYSSSQSFLDRIEKGVSPKLGTTGEDSVCTFEHWMRLQSHAHIKFGLDTPFMVPNEDWTTETNLFQNYGLQWPAVRPWIQQLRTGIIHPRLGRLPVCDFDIHNLDYSATFIKASLTEKFRIEIEHHVGLDASGVQVLLAIIERKLTLKASLQCDLIKQLEKLKLVDQPGEHIPNFNIKISDLCEQIEKCGPEPRDLNLLVMKSSVNSSITIFSQHVNTKYYELRTNPEKYPWRETLSDHSSMYFQL